MKPFSLFLITIYSFILLSCGQKEILGEIEIPEVPDVPQEEETNYIVNWDMEDDVDLAKKEATVGNWSYLGGWREKAATPAQFDGKGINGSRCLALVAPDQTVDVGFGQVIEGLIPGKPYKASARIRAEGVTGGAGAHLSLDYLWAPRSEGVMGTTDWENVVLEFEPEGTSVTLCLKLGNTAADANGVAFFDNVSLKYNYDLYQLESDHIILSIDKKYVSVSEEILKDWLAKLDKVYLAYKELFKGKVPFDGKKITLRSMVIDAWAYAGNPVQWNQDYIADALLQLVKGDWCFGIMHELGHDFAPFMTNSTYAWDFNEELFANFRMFYAIDKLNATIITHASVPQGDGTFKWMERKYVGREIIQLYKSETENCYDRTIAKNRAVEMGNALCYCMCRMVDRYGWELFMDTWEELYAIPRNEAVEKTMNQWEKFEYFMHFLSKHAPEDVHNSFTEGELKVIKAYLETQK